MPKNHRVSRKKLSSKLAYRNPYYKIWEDDIIKPTGKKGKYYWIETHPAVFVVPVTDKMETYLIGQYRYPVKCFCREVVAGGSDGQKPLAAAKRELWEETGLKAKKWKKVGQFCPWNGITNEIDHVFIARELTQTDGDRRAEEGIDEVIKVSLREALRMISQGKIQDGQSIAALTMAAMYLGIIKS